MSIEVEIESQTNACNICFTCSDEISLITNLGEIFRILLKDSPIEVTEAYLETLKACENCSMALRNISNVRDALINTIALENTKKQAIEHDNQLKEDVDVLLCNICSTYSQEVSLSDLAETIEMLVQDSSVELTEKALREMMCCVSCHTKLENISQFQSAIVEEQLKMLSSVDEQEDDISMLSSSQTKEEEEVSDYQHSSAYSPAEEDSDSEETSREEEKYEKGGETRDKALKQKGSMSKETYCLDCNVEIKSPKYLQEHLNHTLKHAVKKHQCDLCKKQYIRLDELKDHIKCDHFGKPYSCSVCNKSYKFKRHLAKHIKEGKHTESSSYCHDCNVDFKNPRYLRHHLHYTLSHAVKQHQCDLCTKGFLRLVDLKVHIQFEHFGKGFSCSICKKLFRFDRDLKKHIKKAHSENSSPKVESPGSYQCEDCGMLFVNKGDYKSHRIKNHKSVNKVAFCEQCNKQFRSRQQYNRHIKFTRYHNGSIASKRYKCSQCDKSFNFKPLMEGHIKYVHENKGHQCPICKKVFPPPYALAAHMRYAHNLPRPQVCTTCNKTFTGSVKCHEKSKGHLEKLNQKIDEL